MTFELKDIIMVSMLWGRTGPDQIDLQAGAAVARIVASRQ